MSQIKVGVLCWLRKCAVPENEGIVVEVLRRHIGFASPELGEGPRWVVKTRDKRRLIVYYQSGHRGTTIGDEFNAAEYQLVPINDPDSVTNEVTDRVLEEV